MVNATSRAAGRALTFLLAVGLIVVWAITGLLFDYSDTCRLDVAPKFYPVLSSPLPLVEVLPKTRPAVDGIFWALAHAGVGAPMRGHNVCLFRLRCDGWDEGRNKSCATWEG